MAFPSEFHSPSKCGLEVHAGEGELPILDQAALLAAVEQDFELLRQLVEIFLAETPALLAQMRIGIRDRKAEAVERTARTLNAAVGNFGGLRASRAALALEIEARANQLDEAKRLLPALEAELVRLCQALSQFLRDVLG